MSIHRVPVKSIVTHLGENLHIKYWSEGASVVVGGFNDEGVQVTHDYSGEAEISDGFNAVIGEELIGELVSQLEADVRENPDMHLG